MSGRLTPKQAIFVAEYQIDFNATRAARAAGAGDTSAAVTGARWLKEPKVAEAIADGQARRMKKLDCTVDGLVLELMKIAVCDPGKLYDENGERIPVYRLDPDTRAAVAAVEDESVDGPGRVRTLTQRLKMADKLRAIELLGKYQRMFTDRIEHDGRITLEELICGQVSVDAG
ncbi:MAG: terminase small subunit [Terracidiphilus sp.]